MGWIFEINKSIKYGSSMPVLSLKEICYINIIENNENLEVLKKYLPKQVFNDLQEYKVDKENIRYILEEAAIEEAISRYGTEMFTIIDPGKINLKNFHYIYKMDGEMENIHKQGVAYKTEEERRKGYLEAQKRHANKPWICSHCDVTILKGNKTNHLKSIKHRFNIRE